MNAGYWICRCRAAESSTSTSPSATSIVRWPSTWTSWDPWARREEERYPTYRGTEEVVYLSFGHEWLGLRPADGGTHSYYDVGIEHLAFEVDTKEEVDAAYQRCLQRGDRVHHPPEEDGDIPGYYALFVFDPDGFRIEVFSPGPEWSSRIHV